MKLNRFILFLTMFAFLFCLGNSIAGVSVAPPKISVSPKSVNLGKIKVSSTSQSIITIRNTGASDLVIAGVSITGPDDFTQTGSCTMISAGGSCPITVTFEPISVGTQSASLSISSNDPKKPTVNVKLSGTALPPKISTSAKSVNFGSVQAGGSSSANTVTIGNTGISALVITDVGITGSDASQFIIQTNDCATIPEGGSCTVTGAFKPTSMGSKRATLTISSNDPKKPALNVKLLGSAASPAPGTAIWDSSQWDNCSWGE